MENVMNQAVYIQLKCIDDFKTAQNLRHARESEKLYLSISILHFDL